jgi:hypothetical protein
MMHHITLISTLNFQEIKKNSNVMEVVDFVLTILRPVEHEGHTLFSLFSFDLRDMGFSHGSVCIPEERALKFNSMSFILYHQLNMELVLF